MDSNNSNTKYNNWFFYALAISIVIGFFVVLSLLIMTKGAESTVNIVIGALVGAFLTVVGYFFGTNKSSEAKTEMIYNSTPIRSANPNLPNPNLPNPNLPDPNLPNPNLPDPNLPDPNLPNPNLPNPNLPDPNLFNLSTTTTTLIIIDIDNIQPTNLGEN